MDKAVSFHTANEASAERREFYERLAKRNAGPLWENLGQLIRTEPRTACAPAVWRYEEMRPLLMEAASLISAKEAERRVLMLKNPGLGGASQITQSLYAGLQLVAPGEIAPSHRHVATASRFIIESKGGYTAVDGERTTMQPGDFIITPSWTFHEHGNPTDSPVIWMDGLDLPVVNMFDTSFAEHYPEETQPLTRQEGDALVRYGANLLPIDYAASRMATPIFNYPYARSREALEQLYRNGPVHPSHGVKMQYVNPVNGGSPMPIMGAFLQLLPLGFRGASYRSTDATVYCVTEGRGRTRAGDVVLEWAEHDIFVTPSWWWVSHEADEQSVLFSFSDRPAQKVLGLWREQFA